jgi:cellulose synthase/poly-beta-1,6-N-acetylglucosamine synthase-like glycosyltransferase
MKQSSKKPWPTKIDKNYQPKVSIIVPTYNESSIILLKLINLSRLRYPKGLSEVIIVDSNSSDTTVEIVRKFAEGEPQTNLRILVEKERLGKSHALNFALGHCSGEVIIVSDVDCFWPANILEKALPFLADRDVGAIGGPKILLNFNQTWVTRIEEAYLRSANSLRLGESKAGSTVFFEGGFTAFKKEAVDRFDPYSTGSDDCGTVIRVIENNYRAILVPEANFYSAFPDSFGGKIRIKLRRMNQLVRVFAEYFSLLIKKKVKTTKKTVVPNVFLYLFSPTSFVVFAVLTIFLLFRYPLLLVWLSVLLIPKVRFYFYQLSESNVLLFMSAIGILVGNRFSIWNQPDDRIWLNNESLKQFNLI